MFKKIIAIISMVSMLGVGAATVSAQDTTKMYVSANSGLNCRTTAEVKDGNIIKAFPRGTELEVIGVDETGKWYEVWDGETQGYCHSNWLVKDKSDVPAKTTSTTSAGSSKGTYLGSFYCTGYTPDPAENGGWGVTACGDNLWDVVGYAIATDPSVIPMGTKVYIEGIGYRVARDTGGAIKGNKIDVLVSSNSESYALTGTYNVYLAE